MSKGGVTSFEKPDVRGYLHRPNSDCGRGIVLTHGAGGNCEGALLVGLASTFCHAGMTVLRCDLPFRQRRPKGPPSPAKAAEDRAGLRSAVSALREIVRGPIILGGQSYGGRQASMLSAEEPDVAAGLLLLSYPLHPPGKPTQLRTQHFPLLSVPTIFVQGTSDSFGSIAELESAVGAIPAPHWVLPVENAAHDLKRGAFDLTRIVEITELAI
jgi:predicted alpha/beta-hydrolase family hydrolase